MADEQQQLDVVKWYTSARKLRPKMGRTPHGSKIPFGPFDTYGVVSAGAVFVGAKIYFDLGLRSGVAPWLVLVAAAIGTYFLIARMPTDGRNPLMVASGLVSHVTASSTGVYRGRTLRLPRPHIAHGRVLVTETCAPSRIPIPDEPAYVHDIATPAPTHTAPAPSPTTAGASTLPGGLTTHHRPSSTTVQIEPAALPAERTITALTGVQRLLASLPDDQK